MNDLDKQLLNIESSGFEKVNYQEFKSDLQKMLPEKYPWEN